MNTAILFTLRMLSLAVFAGVTAFAMWRSLKMSPRTTSNSQRFAAMIAVCAALYVLGLLIALEVGTGNFWRAIADNIAGH